MVFLSSFVLICNFGLNVLQPINIDVEADSCNLSTSCWRMRDLIGPRLYSCYKCRNHVAVHDDIVSKGFQSKNGRAFLFSHAVNVFSGAKEDRQLMTGLHMVADVHCADCGEVLGWKYEKAYEDSQKYKEGKVVLEKFKIVKDNW